MSEREEMPAWPDRKNYETPGDPGPHDADHCLCVRCARFYRDMKEAYAARLRRAMPFMKHDMACFQVPQESGIMYKFICGEPTKAVKCVCGLDDALASIGPLPPRPGNAGETG